MASSQRCLVETGPDGPVTIFKHHWQAAQALNSGKIVEEWPRSLAVGQIRIKVFKRSNSLCERCAARLTWKTMHMDEKVSRGEGGLISMDNCWALCYKCHLGDKESEHGERRWGGRSG